METLVTTGPCSVSRNLFSCALDSPAPNAAVAAGDNRWMLTWS